MSDLRGDDVAVQRQYYERTAGAYNSLHVHAKDEHFFALSFLAAVLDQFDVQSILDVGAGTGRALLYLKQKRPDVRAMGVEPVDALREIGHRSGLSPGELMVGDATRLDFDDQAFDLVCAFGVLHHIRRPEVAVAEMLRVARKAIFISDSNNFGQGSLPLRMVKQLFHALGLWPIVDWIKTRGKGYTFSEEDGLAYSYSVFSNYRQVRRACRSVHVLNTRGTGQNPYRSAGHVALLGMKSGVFL